MSSSCVEQRHAPSTGPRSCSTTQPGEHVASLGDIALISGGFVGLVALGRAASPALLFGVIADGTTAVLIILAMTFGLILPKMGIEHFYPGVTKPIRETPGKAAVLGKFKTRRYRWRFR